MRPSPLPVPALARATAGAWLTAACCLLLAGPCAHAREWKSVDGRTIEAEMLGMEKDKVVVLLPTRQRVSLNIRNLSSQDHDWLEKWTQGKSPLQILPPPAWPANVQQAGIHVKGGPSDNGWFVFKSPHYEFACDAEMSASVMNDFATVAEGTIKLLHSLPITMPSLEGRTLHARILRSEENYLRAGGPPGSAGVFIGSGRGEGVLLVPFESLGIVNFMGKNTKGNDYKATVLIHEMAHQVTAELLPLMPRWMSEGLAEYAAMVPYRNGVFYLGERERVLAMRQRIEFYQQLTRMGVDIQVRWVMKPSELVSTPDRAWNTANEGHDAQIALHRLYISAMYFTHYLLHLADGGDARRIRHYFHTLGDVALWLKTGGQEGSVPDGLADRPALSLEEVRGMFLQRLFTPDELSSIDADFEAKYRALGVGLR